MSSVAIAGELEKITRKGKKGKKEDKNMATNEETVINDESTVQDGIEYKPVQRTVFDLESFDNILLLKRVAMPKKPTSVSEALASLNNDSDRLLNIIHKGMQAETQTAAYNDMSGFKIVDDTKDEESWAEYGGRFADGEVKKKIDAAILTFAKLNGYDKNKSPEEKRKLKDEATEFLKGNKKMMENLQSL